MRIVRILPQIVLGIAGLAALVWGVVLVLPLILGSLQDTVSLAVWFGGGPFVHDGIIAPVVCLLGLFAARWLGPSWRVPVSVGLVITGVIMVLAVPELWRANAGPHNPGLNDKDYVTWLIITLSLLWLLIVGMSLARACYARAKAPARKSYPQKY